MPEELKAEGEALFERIKQTTGSNHTADLTSLVGAPIAIPSLKSQEMVLVRRSEISTLKRGVRRCFDSPVESAYVWASVWFGVGVSALFSLLALVGVDGNDVQTNILAAHIAAVTASFFLAVFCWWFGRKSRNKQKTAHEDLVTDLEELSRRAPTQISEEEAPASYKRPISS